MKIKISLLIIFTILSTIVLRAYNDNDSPWAVGVQGGVNVSNMSGSKDWKSTTGYNVGIFADYQFHEVLFVRAAFSYSTKGASYRNSKEVHDEELLIVKNTKLVRTVGYLHAPLFLGGTIYITDELKMKVLIGGYLGYGISFRNKYSYNKQTSIQETGEVIDSKNEKETINGQSSTYIKKGDIGFTFGLEEEYKNFLLGFTYSKGFRNVSFGGEQNKLYNKWKNANISIYLGYKFNL